MPKYEMSDVRKGEIALAVLKYQVSRDGLRIGGPDMKRQLGNVSKKTGVPQGELKEFWKIFISELLKQSFDE